MPNAEIVANGSEPLLRQIVHTNSAWMAHVYRKLGINPFVKIVVGTVMYDSLCQVEERGFGTERSAGAGHGGASGTIPGA